MNQVFRKTIIFNIISIGLAAPAVLYAFTPGNIPTEQSGLDINNLVDIIFSFLWPIAVAFFIIMFVIAGFLFLVAQGDPRKLEQARGAVLWGIVGVAVALLAFSIPFVIKHILNA